MCKIGHKAMGKCSQCGGIVSVPEVWHGIFLPKPTCESCGAIADPHAHLQTIPTRPVKPWTMPVKPSKENKEYRYVVPKDHDPRNDGGYPKVYFGV